MVQGKVTSPATSAWTQYTYRTIYLYFCYTLSSLPLPSPPSPPPSTGFMGISQPLHAFVKTLICVCTRPLMADAQVCGAYLCSALVMARNVPLIMHLWNSAVWEPSNYPTVAFRLQCHHNWGFIKSPTRDGVVCCSLYIYFFI